MARPAAKELTERELDVMHAAWRLGESTIADLRDAVAEAGLDLAYTTVATLVRILDEKGFLKQTNQERPFRYIAARSYEEVSGRMLDEMVEKVFRGSRENLLLRLMDSQRLSRKERQVLEAVLREDRK